MTCDFFKASRGRPKTFDRDHVLNVAMHTYCHKKPVRGTQALCLLRVEVQYDKVCPNACFVVCWFP